MPKITNIDKNLNKLLGIGPDDTFASISEKAESGNRKYKEILRRINAVAEFMDHFVASPLESQEESSGNGCDTDEAPEGDPNERKALAEAPSERYGLIPGGGADNAVKQDPDTSPPKPPASDVIAPKSRKRAKKQAQLTTGDMVSELELELPKPRPDNIRLDPSIPFIEGGGWGYTLDGCFGVFSKEVLDSTKHDKEIVASAGRFMDKQMEIKVKHESEPGQILVILRPAGS